MTPPVSLGTNKASYCAKKAASPSPRANADEEYNYTVEVVAMSYKKLLKSANHSGVDLLGDIQSQEVKTLACVKAIKAKYPSDGNVILKEIEDLYYYMAFGVVVAEYRNSHGPNLFCLSLSMFTQANQALESLLSNKISCDEFIAGIKKFMNSASNDERLAFSAKYGMVLAYDRGEMNETEISQINGYSQRHSLWGWKPPVSEDMSNRLIYNVATCSIDNELSRYPLAMRAKFPRRMVVAPFSAGSVSWDPGNFAVFSGGTPKILHHELFHWFRRERVIAVGYGEERWHAITSRFSAGAADEPYAGFASQYGKTNDSEDQAEVAGMLFTISADILKFRLSRDPKLLAKVELITNCAYDVKCGMFVDPSGEYDFMRKYGFERPQFYAEWSYFNGKILMDAVYWNGILAENGN